jgi:hypothetical protein
LVPFLILISFEFHIWSSLYLFWMYSFFMVW